MKDQIAAQLSALTEEKSIDKITVKELVNACGISRQTFYYYFQDILDVVEYGISTTLEKNLEKALAENDEYEWIHGFILDVSRHRQELIHLLDSRFRKEVEEVFLRCMRRVVETCMNQSDHDLRMKNEERHFMIDFLTCGIVGLIVSDVYSEMTDPDQFSQMIYHLMKKEL